MTTPLTNAPTLRTERLNLRGPERGDLSAVTKWITTSPRMVTLGGNGSVDDAWRNHLKNVGHWHWHGFGFFTVTLCDDPAPIGRVGLLREAQYPCVELAWHLFDGVEGHGYATEAAKTVRDWARRDLKIDRLVSYIEPTNTRSRATAQRLRATSDGTLTCYPPHSETWEHPAT